VEAPGDGEAGEPLPVALGRRVVAEGRAVAIADVRDGADGGAGLPDDGSGMVAALVAPLREGDGRVIGAFGVASPAPRPWNECHRELLDDLAASAVDAVAHGIGRKRLEDERDRLLERERAARGEAERGEGRYRSLVEAASSIVWDTPASGRFETERPVWSAFTGQTFDELKGWGWLDAVHPDDRAPTAGAWARAVETRDLLAFARVTTKAQPFAPR
jgi:PAS domain-containing protein